MRIEVPALSPEVCLHFLFTMANIFLNSFILFFIYDAMLCLSTLCVLCPKGLEEGTGCLQLVLQMVVSCHVGAGNQSAPSERAPSAHNHSAALQHCD